MRLRAAVLATVALAVAGCGDDEETAEPRLTVSAAASLKGAFEDYAKSFDAATVRYQLRGLRRARGPDPPGREARRLRGREHHPPR